MLEKLILSKVVPGDAAAVHSLYQSLVGTPGCSWVVEYPDLEMVEHDILRGSLYKYCDHDGRIIAAISAGEDENMTESYGGWRLELARPCELARLGVARGAQGQGVAQRLFAVALDEMCRQGFDGARLMVSVDADAARSIYEKLGFSRLGEIEIYGGRFICMEKSFCGE